jgi:hypothetical protein
MYAQDCEELVTRCALHQHKHCVDCGAVLTATGGGGDDGRGVDGYEDDRGNSCESCVSCDNLRCKACALKNPKCDPCIEIEATPCKHCGHAVGPNFKDLGLNGNVVIGPSVLVCASCASCIGCEECRVGA